MKLITLGLCVALCLGLGSSTSYRSERDVTDLMIKYVNRILTRIESVEFNRMIQILANPNYVFRGTSKTKFGNGRATLNCLTCRAMVNTMYDLYEQGAEMEVLINTAVTLCKTLNIQPEHVCRGIIELNADVMLYILQNTPEFSVRSFCGVVMQTEDPTACPYEDERYEWEIDVPAKKSSVQQPKPKDGPALKIAHVTDVHYDPAYEPGALAACDEATCCRKGQTKKTSRNWRALFEEKSTDEHVYVDNKGDIYFDIDYSEEFAARKNMHINREPKQTQKDDRAGYWGDYRDCDSPWWAFADGIDFMAENHRDLDYVYYTGDTIDHGVWETSYELITASLNETYDKFKEAFGDTPVYPGIGNHESQPLDQFAPKDVTEPNVSTRWLYELLNDKWSVWLPESTKESILTGGYYTVVVKPGFRIIVLNSNLCYVYNWWIHYEPQDPSGQFSWLVKVLLEAEEASEKVHILSHIPTGTSEMYSTCSREYSKIAERFSDIIMAEFNGHTHNEEFKVFYKKSGEPFNVAWNGGSLTPYSYVNPNYRVFEVDSETYGVLNAESWIYHLDEANLTPEQRPRWFMEYSFKEHFGIESLSPANVDGLITKMVTTDKSLFSDYHTFRGKSAPRWIDGECSSTCIKDNLCYMVKTELYDNDRCRELFELYLSTEEKKHTIH